MIRGGLYLREGDVTGRVYELAELAGRHRRAIDPERIDVDAVDGCFLGIVPVRSHAKRTARNPDHVRMGRRGLRRGGSRRCNVTFAHGRSACGSASKVQALRLCSLTVK